MQASLMDIGILCFHDILVSFYLYFVLVHNWPFSLQHIVNKLLALLVCSRLLMFMIILL
jgi:hypothetical protein